MLVIHVLYSIVPVIFFEKLNEKAWLPPGKFTKKYAAKQLKRRLQAEERSKLPSTKRRRIQLKQ